MDASAHLVALIRVVVLKLPRNYNFARLNFLPNVESSHFYRIRNFVVTLLRVSH